MIINSMIRRLNEALPGLLTGIVGYGILLQLTGVWLTQEKLAYSIGLWLGIGCAVFMAIHMAVTIEDSLSMNSEKGAKGKMVGGALLRYAVVVIVFFAMMYFEIGQLVPAFLGIMGLKISAYAQPWLDRLKRESSSTKNEE